VLPSISRSHDHPYSKSLSLTMTVGARQAWRSNSWVWWFLHHTWSTIEFGDRDGSTPETEIGCELHLEEEHDLCYQRQSAYAPVDIHACCWDWDFGVRGWMRQATPWRPPGESIQICSHITNRGTSQQDEFKTSTHANQEVSISSTYAIQGRIFHSLFRSNHSTLVLYLNEGNDCKSHRD
jgi:hypothetical protein